MRDLLIVTGLRAVHDIKPSEVYHSLSLASKYANTVGHIVEYTIGRVVLRVPPVASDIDRQAQCDRLFTEYANSFAHKGVKAPD